MSARRRQRGHTIFEESSGGVVYRVNENGQVEVILIAVKGGVVWALPKGHIEINETPEETAIREVREETGVEAEIVDKIGAIDYWFWWKDEDGVKRRHHKVVHFYLMKFKGGDISKHDHEVDAVAWFPIDEAIERIEYENERKLLIKARDMIWKRE
jgi:ADP-ribose pyrophosphatase YjhB (NUDIX family)